MIPSLRILVPLNVFLIPPQKILAVFKHEYEKWEALDWYEQISEDGDDNGGSDDE